MPGSRMFGPYGPLPSPAESYAAGLAVGRSWNPKCEWIPAGPFMCYLHVRTGDADWNSYCAATVANNVQWMAGWHKGRGEKR